MAVQHRAPGTGLALSMGALLLAGCVISPQPEPPSIDADRITIELISTNPDGTELDTAVLRGSDGAVTPGGAVLTVVNLDRRETATTLTVADDGSFVATLGGAAGEEFRLRALAEGLWSRPVDVVAPEETGAALPPTRPLEGCFTVDAPEEVRFGAVAVGDIAVKVVTLRNGCDAAARVDDIRLRVGEGAAADCEAGYGACMTDGRSAEECRPPFDECATACDGEYRSCIGSGEATDLCGSRLDECRAGCDGELRRCTEAACSEALDRCRSADDARPQGFGVLHGGLPMTLSAGATRSVVVTFAPLGPGPAEDVLLISIGSPESERRPVTLTGSGVD